MDRWKNSGRLIGKMAALVLGCIGGGYLLLVAAYSLWSDNILPQAAESCQMLQAEGLYPMLLSRMENSKLDNFTDAQMINISICNEGSAWKRAARGNYIVADGETQIDYLAAAIERAGGADVGRMAGISRYWHGYVVFLRPALFLVSLSGIRTANSFLQLLLVTGVAVYAVKHGKSFLVLPIALAYLLLTPLVMFQTMQFTHVFYVTYMAIPLLLHFLQTGRQAAIPLLFTGIGIAICYFGFLTYPLVSLGLPLALLLLCEAGTFRAQLWKIIQNTVAWLFGYIGMWAGKWAMAAFSMGSGAFEDAINQIQYRTAAQDAFGYPVRLYDVVYGGLECYISWVYLVLLIVVTAYYVVRGLRKKSDLRIAARRSLPFFLVGALPLVWSFFAKNHTFVHRFFTHRIWVVSWFSYFCILLLWGCQKELQIKDEPVSADE